jgi:hypothetical protein
MSESATTWVADTHKSLTHPRSTSNHPMKSSTAMADFQKVSPQSQSSIVNNGSKPWLTNSFASSNHRNSSGHSNFARQTSQKKLLPHQMLDSLEEASDSFRRIGAKPSCSSNPSSHPSSLINNGASKPWKQYDGADLINVSYRPSVCPICSGGSRNGEICTDCSSFV